MTDRELEPHSYPRRILMVVIGMTPQIVTETLYKLAIDQAPPFVPTEVHVVTTQEGAASARHALLGVDNTPGWFHNFCTDFNIDDMRFDESCIHIIGDTEGNFIDDAESTRHNRLAADFITALVSSLTQDESSAVHVSLAGGRKTMSFYAGYALSLYGRMQDRLSHVLVDAAFQNNESFFYPRPIAERLSVDGRYLSTADAKIMLSDIPYVRMRYHLPAESLLAAGSFNRAVETVQQFIVAESLELNLREKSARFNGTDLKLGSPINLAFLLWFCQRVMQGEPPLVLSEDAFLPDFLQAYGRVVGENSRRYERLEEKHRQGDAHSHSRWFWSRLSKLNSRLKSRLGHRLARSVEVQTVDCNGVAGYRLPLLPEQIVIR